jgi:hypothetical protein
MTRPRIPVDGKRADWPRLVADTVNPLITANETKTTQIAALETATDWSALADFADDTAAAAGSVAVGELYRTGNSVRVRIV